MTTEPILRFDQITVEFNDGPVVDQVSFTVMPGECRVILGVAGSGKTVLLKTALGLVRASSGHVFLFGEDITTQTEQQLFEIRSRVGMLFQEGALFDSQTVEENVAYPLLSRLSKPTRAQITEIEARVLESLKFVELGETIEKHPSELSGGMRRRVGIARATVTQPKLVLYDSPTAGLDPITANTIMALVAKERDVRNTATVIVTHRAQDGQLMANFLYNPDSGRLVPDDHSGGGHKTIFMVMRDGRVVFEGSQQELQSSTDPYIHKFVRR